MITISSKPELQPSDNQSTNRPELRHSKILTKLTNVVYLELTITIDKLKELNVHNPKLIDFLANCYQSFINNPDSRFSDLTNGLVPYNFTNQLFENLVCWWQIGYWTDDHFTPIFDYTWFRALQSANNAFNIMNYINYQLIY